jgi:predicted membrane-bound mannosyltransferase
MRSASKLEVAIERGKSSNEGMMFTAGVVVSIVTMLHFFVFEPVRVAPQRLLLLGGGMLLSILLRFPYVNMKDAPLITLGMGIEAAIGAAVVALYVHRSSSGVEGAIEDLRKEASHEMVKMEHMVHQEEENMQKYTGWD